MIMLATAAESQAEKTVDWKLLSWRSPKYGVAHMLLLLKLAADSTCGSCIATEISIFFSPNAAPPELLLESA
jgi:hypothetical protein